MPAKSCERCLEWTTLDDMLLDALHGRWRAREGCDHQPLMHVAIAQLRRGQLFWWVVGGLLAACPGHELHLEAITLNVDARGQHQEARGDGAHPVRFGARLQCLQIEFLVRVFVAFAQHLVKVFTRAGSGFTRSQCAAWSVHDRPKPTGEYSAFG